MAKKRKVYHRRRREGRTNFKSRLAMIKSKKPRLVIRRFSNSYQCQIVNYETNGDKTVLTVSKKNLSSLGWKYHGGNLPSAYLIGYVCGKEAVAGKKIKEAILDLGMQKSTKGSGIYSALRGCLDGGLEVSHSEGILPNMERVSGKHIADFALKLKKEDPEKYKKTFSSYIKNKAVPEEIQKKFEEAKKKAG